MRIAICFSGQNRTGHATADNIKRYIGDLLPNCDVFAHFWDSETRGTGYANRLGESSVEHGWHDPSLSSKEKFVEFYRQWMPRSITTEEYDLQPSKKLWAGRRWDPVAEKYQVSMWRSVYEANKLKMDYAQKNQIVYDYTVRLRSDIVFGKGKSLAKDIAEIPDQYTMLFGDHYHIWDYDGRARIEDIFFVASSLVMDQMSSYCFAHANTIANIDDPKQPGYQDWQWHMYKWMIDTLGLKVSALTNSMMRIYTEQDIAEGIDPLDPGFGRAPLYGAYNDKNIEKIRRW
jgi:hypothetical protein